MRTIQVKSKARALAVLARFRDDDPALTWQRTPEGDAFVVFEPGAGDEKTAALILEVRP